MMALVMGGLCPFDRKMAQFELGRKSVGDQQTGKNGAKAKGGAQKQKTQPEGYVFLSVLCVDT
jgi:hypothetical protein